MQLDAKSIKICRACCLWDVHELIPAQKVVLVGYSPSGVDIASQIGKVCAQPLLLLQKAAAGLSPGSLGFAEGKAMMPQIRELDAKGRAVTFVDGHVE